MQLKKVLIHNFRALEDLEIEFNQHTVLIGANNSGKTTVLKALDWFFHGDKNSLNEKDISHHKEPSQNEIYVEVTFDQLSPEDENTLGPKYTKNKTKTFTARKTFSSGSVKITGLVLHSPIFSEFYSATSATEKKTAWSRIMSKNPEVQIPAWSSQENALNWLTDWENTNIDSLTLTSGDATHLHGFAGSSLLNSLFEYIYVPVDLSVGTELNEKKNSTLGKILELSINRELLDNELLELGKKFEQEKSELEEKHLKDQLRHIASQLTSITNGYMQGPKVSLAPTSQKTVPQTSNIAIEVLDNETLSAPELLGHGFQRALIIGALQLLVENRSLINGKKSVCFAIEEPELFQHPGQAKVFARTLSELVAVQDSNSQLLVVTHSPYFINPSKFENIRRISAFNSLEAGQTYIHSTNPKLIQDKYAIENSETKLATNLAALTMGSIGEAFFAKKVILTEGMTDVAFWSAFALKKFGSTYSSDVAIVPVTGKSNLIRAFTILTELGIEISIIFDADFSEVTENADKKRARDSSIRLNRKICSLLDVPEEDFPMGQLGSRGFAFRKNLEDFFTTEWPEYKSRFDEIRREMGLESGSKNHVVYEACFTDLADQIPDSFDELIPLIQFDYLRH